MEYKTQQEQLIRSVEKILENRAAALRAGENFMDLLWGQLLAHAENLRQQGMPGLEIKRDPHNEDAIQVTICARTFVIEMVPYAAALSDPNGLGTEYPVAKISVFWKSESSMYPVGQIYVAQQGEWHISGIALRHSGKTTPDAMRECAFSMLQGMVQRFTEIHLKQEESVPMSALKERPPLGFDIER